MYYSGIAGACAGGGEHSAGGSFAFQTLFNCPPSAARQPDWASCSKCRVLYYRPFNGSCAAGGTYDSTGSFDYDLIYTTT